MTPSDASAGGGGTSSDGGACGSLANVAAVVHPMVDQQNALPIPQGGAISDGTYVLTSETQYAKNSAGAELYISCGAELGDVQETVLFAGGTFQAIWSYNGSAATPYGGTFSTSGTTLTTSQSCPVPSDSSQGYTATPTTILLIGSPGPTDTNGTCGPIVVELTLRP